MANGKTLAPDPRSGSGWVSARSLGVSPKAYQDLKTKAHRELINRVDLEKLTSLEDVKARLQVQDIIHEYMGGLETPLSSVERDRLSREVLHEVFGLGPLEPLLQDPTISDILVNTCRSVYVERAGFWRRRTSCSRTRPICDISSTRSSPRSDVELMNHRQCAMPALPMDRA